MLRMSSTELYVNEMLDRASILHLPDERQACVKYYKVN